MSEKPPENECKHVTLVRLTEDDPINDHEEGKEQFRPGLHEDGGSYAVMGEDGEEIEVGFETVDVFSFTRPIPKSEALDRAVAQAKALREREDQAEEQGAA